MTLLHCDGLHIQLIPNEGTFLLRGSFIVLLDLLGEVKSEYWHNSSAGGAGGRRRRLGDGMPLPEREGGKFGELPGIAPSRLRRLRQRKNKQT